MPPRLARLLAVVAAVGLVAGAFAVRGALAGDDDPGSRDDRSANEAGVDPDPSGATTFEVLCDADLDEVCEAVGRLPAVDAVRTVTLAEVLSAAASAEDDGIGLATADAWLTLDPMPGVLDQTRIEEDLPPLVTEDARVEVGSASLSLLAFEETLDCSPARWRCVAEAASGQDVGLPGLTTSAGLAIAGAAFVALAGDDIERGIRAFEGETADLLDDLVEGAERTLDDQQGTIVTQRGRYDGVITTGGLAELRTTTSAAAGLVVAPLEPQATVGVVLVGLGGDGEVAVEALGEAVLDQTVADLLAAAGWDGEAASSSGLPDADVVYALQERLGS